MIQALLWDNDGLLVDSEALFFETTRAVFQSAGLALETDLWRRAYLGQGLHSVDIARLLGASAQLAEAVVASRTRLFRQRLEAPIPLRPHIANALERWKATHRMAVVTSAPQRQFDLIHAHTGLREYFECVITADDCRKLKPDPEPYLNALARMALKPEACLAIEDTPRGLASAAAAGIRCVVIRTPLTEVAACHGAQAIIDDASGLEKVLAGLV